MELSDYINDKLTIPITHIVHGVIESQNPDVPRHKYNVTPVPINIFDSARCCSAFVNSINMLQYTLDCQKIVNDAYDNLLSVVHTEMDASLNYNRDMGLMAHKKTKHMGKPW